MARVEAVGQGGEVFDEGFGAGPLDADGQVVVAAADGFRRGIGPISARGCGQGIDAGKVVVGLGVAGRD